MKTLILTLSDPRKAVQFEDWTKDCLLERKVWNSAIQSEVEAQGASWGIHRLDIAAICSRVLDSPAVKIAIEEEVLKTPREAWFELDSPKLLKIAVILDLSDSAKPHHKAIGEYSREFVSVASSFASWEFWAWDEENHDHGSALRAARSNASLWRPVWTRLQPKLASNILTHAVVIGSGRIFDIEDFKDAEHIERVLFVPLHESLTGGCLPESGPPASQLVAPLLTACGDTSILVGGEGTIPIWWDNPAYVWNGEFLEFQFARLAGGESAALRCGCLCRNETVPQAFERRGGHAQSLGLKPIAPISNRTHASGVVSGAVTQHNRQVVLPCHQCPTNRVDTGGPESQTYMFENGKWLSSTP